MTKQPHLSVQTGLNSIIPFGVHVSPPNTVYTRSRVRIGMQAMPKHRTIPRKQDQTVQGRNIIEP